MHQLIKTLFFFFCFDLLFPLTSYLLIPLLGADPTQSYHFLAQHLKRPQSLQPNCWSFLVSSFSLSSTYWLWLAKDRSVGFPSSFLLLDRSSLVSANTEELVEDEAEASIAEVVLVSSRLLLTILKPEEQCTEKHQWVCEFAKNTAIKQSGVHRQWH